MLKVEKSSKSQSSKAGAKAGGKSTVGVTGGVQKVTGSPPVNAAATEVVPKKPAPPKGPNLAAFFSNLPKDVPSATLLDAIVQETGIEPKHVEVLKAGLPGKARSCGLASALFTTEAEADEVAKRMDGKLLIGRPMICRRDKFVEDAPVAATKAAKARQ